jgi:hypothetical protein
MSFNPVVGGVDYPSILAHAESCGWINPARKNSDYQDDASSSKPNPARFEFIPASALKNKPRIGWRVLDVIPKTGLVVMWGQPGSGKSFAAFDIGAAIARGERYQGKRVKQGLVLIIAAEGDLTARTMAYMKEKRLSDSDMSSLMILQRSVNMLDPRQDMTDLMAAIKAAVDLSGEELALVIVDTLNRVMPGGNENSSEDMGAVINNAKLIEDGFNCAVMFIHHSGKDEGKGTRGHSSLKGAMDSEISIGRNEDIRTFRIEKSKEGKDYYDLFNFRLKTIELGPMRNFDPEADAGEVLTSCVVEETKDAMVKEVAKNHGKKRVLSLAKYLEKQEGKKCRYIELRDIYVEMTKDTRNFSRVILDGVEDGVWESGGTFGFVTLI